MDKEIIANAIEKLSNTMRIYIQMSIRFPQLRLLEEEEAINNLDRAFEAKLEAFHSVYDVTKDEISYFDYADTSFLIMLRNAIHHNNHFLFKSWNYEMHLNSGMKKYADGTFLLVNYNVSDKKTVSKYFIKLEDIFNRIEDENNRLKKDQREELLRLCNQDLSFTRILEYARTERFPIKQVYINVIPIFMRSMNRLAEFLDSNQFDFKGFDSGVYVKHLLSEPTMDLSDLNYKHLKIPFATK
jgi:hypothetical protein